MALPCGVLYIVYRLLVNVYWSLNTAPASLNFNRSSLNEAEGTINLSPLTSHLRAALSFASATSCAMALSCNAVAFVAVHRPSRGSAASEQFHLYVV